MSLEELNEEVYKRPSESEPQLPAEQFVFPTPTPSQASTVTPSRWADRVAPLQKLTFKEHFLRRKKLILGLVSFLLIVMAVLVFIGRRSLLFDPAAVEVKLTGPKVTKTGEQVTFTVQYDNPNWVGLAASELTITYPETFHLANADGWQVSRRQATRKLDPLGGRDHGQLMFTGNFQSFNQTSALLSASLRYGPEGLSSQDEKRSEWGVELERSLVSLTVNGPPSVVSGQGVEYVIEYQNDGEEILENGAILLEYPEGFTPTAFDPKPKREEKLWSIGSLQRGMRGAISIKGVVMGQTGDSKRMVARLGKEQGDGQFQTLVETNKVTQVLAPPLSLDFSAGDSMVVKSGQSISFRLGFRNEGSFGLRDLVATIQLDNTLLDIGALNAPKGSRYSADTHELVLKAAEVPSLRSLEPGQTGEVSFSVPLRKDLVERGMHEVSLRVIASLDSPDLPHAVNTESLIAQKEVSLKVQTEATGAVNGYFYDDTYPNTGPIPPQIGAETTYTLYLSTGSTLNSLSDGKFVVHFPTLVRFLGVVAGDSSAVSFNERTGELVWKTGTIAYGTTKTIAIRIGVTPPPNTAGKEIEIVNRADFSAKDTFTGVDLDVALPKKTTLLSEDTRLGRDNGIVAP